MRVAGVIVGHAAFADPVIRSKHGVIVLNLPWKRHGSAPHVRASQTTCHPPGGEARGSPKTLAPRPSAPVPLAEPRTLNPEPSVCSSCPADGGDGLEQVLDVLEDRVLRDVHEFELDALIEG